MAPSTSYSHPYPGEGCADTLQKQYGRDATPQPELAAASIQST